MSKILGVFFNRAYQSMGNINLVLDLVIKILEQIENCRAELDLLTLVYLTTQLLTLVCLTTCLCCLHLHHVYIVSILS